MDSAETPAQAAARAAESEATRVRVEASKLHDPERWTLGYTAHTATALRRRVLAAGNGRSVLASGVTRGAV